MQNYFKINYLSVMYLIIFCQVTLSADSDVLLKYVWLMTELDNTKSKCHQLIITITVSERTNAKILKVLLINSVIGGFRWMDLTGMIGCFNCPITARRLIITVKPWLSGFSSIIWSFQLSRLTSLIPFCTNIYILFFDYPNSVLCIDPTSRKQK